MAKEKTLQTHVRQELAERVWREARTRNLSMSSLLERILEGVFHVNDDLVYTVGDLDADLEESKGSPIFDSSEALIADLHEIAKNSKIR